MKFLIGLIVWFSNTLVMYAQESSYRLFAENGVVNQSATNFGKYLFIFMDKMASISLYDLEERAMVYTLKLTPHSEQSNNVSVYHCNQCNFGKEKYTRSDFFPLLYVCQRSVNGTSPGFMNVLRIVPQFDDKRRIISFFVNEVQRIQFPLMTDQNCMGNPCAVIDQKRGYIYTYSRNYNQEAPNYLNATFSKFKLPQLKTEESGVHQVYLNDNDILDSFTCDFSSVNMQGAFFRKGKIYVMQGYPSKNPKMNFVYFRGIDVKRKKQVQFVDMLADGFKEEPEGCWFYKNKVMISTNGNKLYSLHGKRFKVK